MAGTPPRHEPETTPRQTPLESLYPKGPDVHVPGRIESWDVWGQKPEPGNPSADLQPGTLSHKAWKVASLWPFPMALPHKIKRGRTAWERETP